MARKIVRKKKSFSEVSPLELGAVVPEDRIVVELDTEDTKWLLVFKDDTVAVLLAMDGTYDTISIPITQFNRNKYSYKADDGNKYTAKLKIYSED